MGNQQSASMQQLHKCAIDGDLTHLRVILAKVERTWDVDTPNAAGESALVAAVRARQVGSVGLLIDAGADVNYRFDGGKTPLFLAVSLGHRPIAATLLQAGASMHSLDDSGRTILDAARDPETRRFMEHHFQFSPERTALEQFFQALRTRLLTSHRTLTLTLKHRMVPARIGLRAPIDVTLWLAAAILQAHYRAVRARRVVARLRFMALCAAPVLRAQRVWRGQRARRQVGVAKSALQALQRAQGRADALLLALASMPSVAPLAVLDVAQDLLDAGALVAQEALTPLGLLRDVVSAARRPELPNFLTRLYHLAPTMLPLVLQRVPGVLVSGYDESGSTFAHAMVEAGDTATLTACLTAAPTLFESNLSLRQQTGDLHTVCTLAAARGQAGVLAILLAAPGVDAGVSAIDQRTALHFATETDCVTLLMQHMPRLAGAFDAHNVTPLHTAIVRRSVAGVAALVSLGADVNCGGLETPLTTAVLAAPVDGTEDDEIVSLLLACDGLDLSLCNSRKLAATQVAAAAGSVAILKQLVVHSMRALARRLADTNNVLAVNRLTGTYLGLAAYTQELGSFLVEYYALAEPITAPPTTSLPPAWLALERGHVAAALFILQGLEKHTAHCLMLLFATQQDALRSLKPVDEEPALQLALLLLTRLSSEISHALHTTTGASSDLTLAEIVGKLSVLLPAFCLLEASGNASVADSLRATITPWVHDLCSHPRVTTELAWVAHERAGIKLPHHAAVVCSSLACRAVHASAAAWEATCDALFALLNRSDSIASTNNALIPLIATAPPAIVATHSPALLRTLLAVNPFRSTCFTLASALLSAGLARDSTDAHKVVELAVEALKKNRGTDMAKEAGLLLAAHAPEFLPTCDICSGLLTDPVSVGENFANHWHTTKKVCSHEYCRDCLVTWIGTELSFGRFNVRCPCPGCFFHMYRDDVQRVAPKALDDYDLVATADLRANTVLLATQYHRVCWLNDSTRVCPHCFLVIERSHGCNTMDCTCGRRFDWQQAATLASFVDHTSGVPAPTPTPVTAQTPPAAPAETPRRSIFNRFFGSRSSRAAAEPPARPNLVADRPVMM